MMDDVLNYTIQIARDKLNSSRRNARVCNRKCGFAKKMEAVRSLRVCLFDTNYGKIAHQFRKFSPT